MGVDYHVCIFCVEAISEYYSLFVSVLNSKGETIREGSCCTDCEMIYKRKKRIPCVCHCDKCKNDDCDECDNGNCGYEDITITLTDEQLKKLQDEQEIW